MICPYNRKAEKQVLQVTNEYDEDGKADSTQQITSCEFTMMECPKRDAQSGETDAAAITLIEPPHGGFFIPFQTLPGEKNTGAAERGLAR